MSDGQASRVGSMFGPYHLKRLLGRGGMGEVYEAEHTVKEWTVAVKLMSDTFSRDPVSQANNVIVDINACATTSAIKVARSPTRSSPKSTTNSQTASPLGVRKAEAALQHWLKTKDQAPARAGHLPPTSRCVAWPAIPRCAHQPA
jgi:serine/threonine protein kinase